MVTCEAMTTSKFRDYETRDLCVNVEETLSSPDTLEYLNDNGVEEGDVSDALQDYSSWPIKMEERRGLRITTWNGTSFDFVRRICADRSQ